MKYRLILLFILLPVLLIAQDAVQAAPDTIPAEENITTLEYKEKPKEVTFAEPFKLMFTLPKAAAFDGQNISQKDFEILAVGQDKDNPLLTVVTVLPLNLQVSTLTALGFTAQDGEKFQTEPLEIDIKEMPSKVQGLIDIRGPYRPLYILPYIIIIIILALIIYAVIYFKKRKKQPVALNLTPYQKQERPMHEIALSQLDILIQSNLWEQNKYKLYYSEISDILRQFLAARFNFEAQNMTARELFKKLKTIKDFKFDFNVLQKFQQSMSLVKFAKAVPTTEDRDKALITAKDLIIENKETDLSRYQLNNAKQGDANGKAK